MPLWTDAIKDGFRLVLKARLLLAIPLGFDLAMLALVVPATTSPQFTLPVALPSVSQVRGSGGAALPFFPLYVLPSLGDLTLTLLLLVLVVQAYLAAGYVGRLEVLRGTGAKEGFFAAANRAFARILAFFAITTFVLLVSAPLLRRQEGPELAAYFVLALVLGVLYFLFLTPFVVIMDNTPLSMGLRNSIRLAAREFRELVPYCLGYAAITLLASIAFHLLGWGPVGLFLFPVLYSVVGTALVGSTLYLYAGLRPAEPMPAGAPEPEALEEAAPA